MRHFHSILALTFVTFASSVLGQDCPMGYGRTLNWISCATANNSRLQCATLDVPLDYSAPSTGGILKIPLIRQPARDDLVGIEVLNKTIIYNPGGPGASGVDSLASGGGLEIQSIAGQGYHIVSFDPRGIGLSKPFDDGTNNYNCPRVSDSPGGPFISDQEIQDAFDGYTSQGDLCATNDYTRKGQLVGTAYVARDVVAIANALQEDGLVRYYGFSYGTLLGVTLSAMFPQRLDRVVLDGNINPSDYYFGLGAESIANVDNAVAEFFVQCVAAGKTLCPLVVDGESAKQLQDRFDRYLSSLYGINKYAWFQAKGEMFNALHGPSGWPDYAAMLASNYTRWGIMKRQTNIPFDPLTAAAAAKAQPNSLSAVTCGDWQIAPPATVQDFKSWLALYNQTSFYAGDISMITVLWQCSRWSVRAKERFAGPYTGITTRNPILFVQTMYDPVTPLISAENSSAGFLRSGVLRSSGTGHCSTVHPSTLLNQQVGKYFASGVIPDTSKVYEPDFLAFQVKTPLKTGDASAPQKRDFVFPTDLMTLNLDIPSRVPWYISRRQGQDLPVGCVQIDSATSISPIILSSTTPINTLTTQSTTTTSYDTTAIISTTSIAAASSTSEFSSTSTVVLTSTPSSFTSSRSATDFATTASRLSTILGLGVSITTSAATPSSSAATSSRVSSSSSTMPSLPLIMDQVSASPPSNVLPASGLRIPTDSFTTTTSSSSAVASGFPPTSSSTTSPIHSFSFTRTASESSIIDLISTSASISSIVSTASGLGSSTSTSIAMTSDSTAISFRVFFAQSSTSTSNSVFSSDLSSSSLSSKAASASSIINPVSVPISTSTAVSILPSSNVSTSTSIVTTPDSIAISLVRFLLDALIAIDNTASSSTTTITATSTSSFSSPFSVTKSTGPVTTPLSSNNKSSSTLTSGNTSTVSSPTNTISTTPISMTSISVSSTGSIRTSSLSTSSPLFATASVRIAIASSSNLLIPSILRTDIRSGPSSSTSFSTPTTVSSSSSSSTSSVATVTSSIGSAVSVSNASSVTTTHNSAYEAGRLSSSGSTSTWSSGKSSDSNTVGSATTETVNFTTGNGLADGGAGRDRWTDVTTTSKTTASNDSSWKAWYSQIPNSVTSIMTKSSMSVLTITKCLPHLRDCTYGSITTKAIPYTTKATIPTTTVFITSIVDICSTGLTMKPITITATCSSGCTGQPTDMPTGYATTTVWCSACAIPSFIVVTSSGTNGDQPASTSDSNGSSNGGGNNNSWSSGGFNSNSGHEGDGSINNLGVVSNTDSGNGVSIINDGSSSNASQNGHTSPHNNIGPNASSQDNGASGSGNSSNNGSGKGGSNDHGSNNDATSSAWPATGTAVVGSSAKPDATRISKPSVTGSSGSGSTPSGNDSTGSRRPVSSIQAGSNDNDASSRWSSLAGGDATKSSLVSQYTGGAEGRMVHVGFFALTLLVGCLTV